MLFDEWSKLWIPKDLKDNLAWRQEILEKARGDGKFAEYLVARLRESPVLFINLLCNTQQVFIENPDGTSRPVPPEFTDVPFITWPCQDRELIRLHRCSEEGKNLWANKSRKMGWTWLNTAYFVWRFLLFQNYRIRIASRKEDAVKYIPGPPDTLLSFIVYQLNNEAVKWLMPKPYEMKGNMSVMNPNTGAAIFGESTNADVGRGGRMQIAMIDEAAAVDELREILRSLRDAASTLVLLSTPKRGSYFNELATSQDYEKGELPWYEHPQKGANRYMGTHTKDPRRKCWRSPWYDAQWKVGPDGKPRRDERDIAENVDMDLAGSGDAVFDANILRQHREEHCRQHSYEGDILFAHARKRDEVGEYQEATAEPDMLAEADEALKARDGRVFRFHQRPGGRWRIWCPLEHDHHYGGVRPPQDDVYFLGCDPGDGRMLANSVIQVFSLSSGEQVAEFASAEYPARDIGRILVAAALWFGGSRMPMVNWETNGVGGNVTDVIVKRLRYPCVFNPKFDTRNQRATAEHGWHSNPASKRTALELLSDMMTQGQVKIRSDDLIREAGSFIIYERGGVGVEKLADENTGARESHGDRVMAAAVAVMMLPHAARTERAELLIRSKHSTPNSTYGRMVKAQREASARQTRPQKWRRF